MPSPQSFQRAQHNDFSDTAFALFRRSASQGVLSQNYYYTINHFFPFSYLALNLNLNLHNLHQSLTFIPLLIQHLPQPLNPTIPLHILSCLQRMLLRIPSHPLPPLPLVHRMHIALHTRSSRLLQVPREIVFAVFRLRGLARC